MADFRDPIFPREWVPRALGAESYRVKQGGASGGAPQKKNPAGRPARPGRHGGPAPHSIFYTIFYILYAIFYILYIILYRIYKILYKIWYGGPARHAGLAGRPIFFLEGPRPAPPARILMAPEAPQKRNLAGRPGRHGGPAPHTISYINIQTQK